MKYIDILMTNFPSLAKIKSEMSEEEIEALVKKTADLKIYQETPSTEEALNTIPVLKREDLSRDVEPFYNKVEKINDVEVVRHDIFTNGIAYFSGPNSTINA